ncbi:MAG: hypothetical protein GY820_48525, partial [Gammaproteobacteria bacterium]|nr:hypothetical protein [Gammaproteobacteria bacterium]
CAELLVPWYGNPAYIAALSALLGAAGLRGGQKVSERRRKLKDPVS